MAVLSFEVDLLEDNAGNLYLHPLNSTYVYQTEPHSAMTFEEEASDLIENEPRCRREWSKEWVHLYRDIKALLAHPETHLIASWSDGKTTFLKPPGRAGEQYLRLPKEERN